MNHNDCPACEGHGTIPTLPWRQFMIAHPFHKSEPVPHELMLKWFVDHGHTITYTIGGIVSHALPFGDSTLCWKCNGYRVGEKAA